MPEKITKKQIKDFISHNWTNFSSKYSKKIDMSSFLNNVVNEEFDESHIAVNHSTSISETQNKAGVISSIRADLVERGFEEKYISDYIKEISKLKPEDVVLRAIKNDILPSFRYRDKPMTLIDLREDMTLQDITTVSVDDATKAAIVAQIKVMSTQVPSYEKGLMLLISELDTLKTEVEYTPLSRAVSSVTRISPSNKNDREEIYQFYEDRYSLYDDLKNSMKEVLEIWDDVEEELEDVRDEEGKVTGQKSKGYGKKQESNSRRIEELDSELDRMKDLYNEMDEDKNYIIKTGLLDYSIITDRDRSVSASVETTLLRTLTELLGDEELQEFQEAHEDDEDYYQVDQQTVNFGQEGGEKEQPKAETNFRAKTEEESRQEQEYDKLMDDLNTFNVIRKVDPLFIIASHQGIIKNKYSIESWKKTKTELNNRLQDATKSNPGAISIYRAALASHEEYQEQAFDSGERRNFYFPISESAVAALQHIDEVKLPLDKIEAFHLKLVKLIIDLLEDPLEKSTIPIHLQPHDLAPGKEEAGQQRLPQSGTKESDRMKEQFNLLHRLKLGKKGKKREVTKFTKFSKSLLDLFNIADQYYGDPIRELMIPYNTIPSYLDADTLNALINHGPENIAQITLGLYRDYYHSAVTPRDLRKLTDYLVSSNQARKSPEDMEKKANRVLDVLEKLVPNNVDSDIHWFANEFKQQAKRDSSFDISGITLQNRKIEGMMFDKSKHKTSYHPLIWMIYKFGGQFKKNVYASKDYDAFEMAYEQQSATKLASVQSRILEAHDDIRKMLGKPIYYNTCQLGSFNHISDTIDIIKEQYKVELTGSDITGIVNEFDSMETIAKRYGINSNAVYHVKAMFR